MADRKRHLRVAAQANGARSCSGSQSAQARQAMWEEFAKPAIVEFEPGLSTRIRFQRLQSDLLIRGSKEGRTTFERLHGLLFQDCTFEWRRMNPVKDTFLTTNMRLPTPKLHIDIPKAAGLSISPVSQPMWKLASVFHDWNDVHSRGVDLEEVGRRPLERRHLPEVREFTMMSPRLQADDYWSQTCSLQTPVEGHWSDVLPALDDSCSETTAASDRNHVDVPRSRPQWYGFRYYLGSGRLEFSPLAWYEVQEMVLAGENSWSGLPGMVVKLWIVRPGEETSLGTKPHHDWREVRRDMTADDEYYYYYYDYYDYYDDDDDDDGDELRIKYVRRLWQLTKLRFERPIYMTPSIIVGRSESPAFMRK